MFNIQQIVEGTYNNVTNRNEALYNERIKICRACPLLKKDKIFGEMCDPSLYINPKGKTSSKELPGYVRGCGCIMASKTRVDEAHCIVNKW